MATDSNLNIIDTHCHIINQSKLSYPWLANVEALNQDWTLEAYQQEASKAGISRILHVEVDVAPHLIRDETHYLSSLAEKSDGYIAGIIASCRPESNDFESDIDFAKNHPLIKGFRRVLHVVSDETSQTSIFKENIKKLANTNLVFDICTTANQLPIALELIDAAPHTSFVLNHCGNPDIANDAWEHWSSNIDAIAERNNVHIKLSGIPTNASDNWVTTDLEKWVHHVLNAFGSNRVVWGGDWPVVNLGGGLSKWTKASRELLSSLSDNEQQHIYNDNAEQIWSLNA